MKNALIRMNKFALLLSVILFSKSLSAQQKLFDVSLFGKKVGDLKIERIELSPIRETIKMINEIAIKSIMINRWSKTLLNTLWENKVLIDSDYDFKSESASMKVRMFFNKTHYGVKTDTSNAILNCGPIKCTTNRLFFEEPINHTHVFSEKFTKYFPLKKYAANEYGFTVSDGTVNIYKYKNGNLYEIEIRKPFGTGYVRLVN